MSVRPSIAHIERAFAAGWPALEVVRSGAWEARLAGGLTRRANTIQSYDPTDDGDAPARLPALAALYRAHGLPPLFRVTPLTGRADYRTFCRSGWQLEADSLVMDRALSGPIRVENRAGLFAPTDPDWIAAQANLKRYDPDTVRVFEALVGRIAAPSTGLQVTSDDATVAAGLCAVVKSIAVLVTLVTAPAHRGQGAGTALMASALDWAFAHGARHAALQVEAGNIPALALHRKLGFAFRYPYHYRRAPEAPQ